MAGPRFKKKVYVIRASDAAAKREQQEDRVLFRVRSTSAGRALRYVVNLCIRMSLFRGRPIYELSDLIVVSIDRSPLAKWDYRT